MIMLTVSCCPCDSCGDTEHLRFKFSVTKNDIDSPIKKVVLCCDCIVRMIEKYYDKLESLPHEQ